VSVVDETGNLLADGAGDVTGGILGSAEERQVGYEKRLKDQVESIVSSVVGPGRARVQLSAEFDFNRVTETSDKIDPEGRVLRSSQTREEQAQTDNREWDGPAALPPPTALRVRGGLVRRRSTTMPHKSTVHAVTAIGIDMGKNTLHMVGLDLRGAIVLREKVSRGRIASRLANLQPCLIGIEAGMATHYVARELAALGHDVKQVPPTYAKPFRQGHKNDFRDAHAVAEAVQRPTTRFVPAKTNEQLDLQALHRVRSRLVSERTAVINQIRGFLLERGIIVRQGVRFLRQQLPDILAKRADVLSPRMVRIVTDLAGDWRQLDERIETVTDEIEMLAKSDDNCRRVMTVPGIGPIISSAMVAAIGSGAAFARGRDYSAWLGLVPKQMSTGDRTILGRISKRGNGYLRTLFMQAARVILLRPANWPKHGFGAWLIRAAQRLHPNVLAAALANKLARIAWTVLAQERSYEARVTKTAA
jgi:transposase